MIALEKIGDGEHQVKGTAVVAAAVDGGPLQGVGELQEFELRQPVALLNGSKGLVLLVRQATELGRASARPLELLSLLRGRQSEWRQRYQLQRIGLFGSTVRNQATATSDVDVWVELDPLTPFATVHLKEELEQLLQRPIDLVRLRERMNPALRAAILKEGISA